MRCYHRLNQSHRYIFFSSCHVRCARQAVCTEEWTLDSVVRGRCMTCHIRVRRLAAVLHNLQGTQSQAICPAGWTLTVLMVLFHTYLLVWKIVTVSHSLNRIVHACRISLSQPTLTIQWGWQRTRVCDSLSESLFHWSNFNQAESFMSRGLDFFLMYKSIYKLWLFLMQNPEQESEDTVHVYLGQRVTTRKLYQRRMQD